MSNFQIICGDALEEMRKMPDASFDAIIADPPYATTQCAWDQPLDWASLWPELWRVCKSETSPVVLFSAQPFTTDLINSQRKFFRYELIWEKTMPTGFLDANRRPLRNHENILVFSQKGYGNYEAQKEEGFAPYGKTRSFTQSAIYGAHTRQKTASTGDRHPTSVWTFQNRNQAEEHPTQKPVPLMERLVMSYTQPGDSIFDFTCGSGTTLVAALKNGRRAVGIEREPEYAELTRQRCEAATGKFSPRDFGGLFAEPTP